MRDQLKNYLKNTVNDDTDSWEAYYLNFEQHFTRSSFLKQNKELIHTLLQEIQDEKYTDMNSSFSSVSTLIMDIDE